MTNQVLCTCVWCLQESNGLGKLVSKATRTRHIANQKKTWINPTDIPSVPPRRPNTSISQAALITSGPTLTMPLVPLPININNNHNEEFVNIDEENPNHDEEFININDTNPEIEKQFNDNDSILEISDEEEEDKESDNEEEIDDIEHGKLMIEFNLYNKLTCISYYTLYFYNNYFRKYT